VYDQLTGIPGLTIAPGPITQISLSPANSSTLLSTSKNVLYQLSFLPSNSIPLGGSIQLLCTPAFTFANFYFIDSGLSDLSQSNPATFSYNAATFTLTISSFQQFSPQKVSLFLFIKTPALQDSLIQSL
jgi:hypothetical protein